jgi:methylated-DNA-[protein]-cysteine S-methyltransferase
MIYKSPIGPLQLLAGSDGLCRLRYPPHTRALTSSPGGAVALRTAVSQLEQYFAGGRREFELPLELGGTPFQLRVWDALQRIPYGETTSYGALARALGERYGGDVPEPRAVASAIARTPVPIVIPCHRVIGADGSLTGYGGGLRRKRALLDFEAAGGDRAALEDAWNQRQLALL